MEKLKTAFQNCEKLQRHVKLLLKNGSLYKVYNHNLLYHGCIPLEEDGSFEKVNIFGISGVDRNLRCLEEARWLHLKGI